MKIFTHNLLMCNKKGCTLNNYPLKIKSTNTIIVPHEYNHDEVKAFLKKVDWKGLESACKDVNITLNFNYENLTEEQKNSDEFLKFMNNVLFETVIQDGTLYCEGCKREYKITNGISYLNLNDDEL